MANTRSSGKKVYAGLTDKKKPRKRHPRPAGRPAPLPVPPPAPAPSQPPAAPKSYVDKGSGKDTPMSPPAGRPDKPKAKTPTPSPRGGVSKSRSGSKQKTPPPSPVDPLWVKRRGKFIANNLQVIPVLDGRPAKRFTQVQLPATKGLWNKGELGYRNATLQALFHVPAFYRYLGKTHKNCRSGPTSACVVCALQWLAQAYYNNPATIRGYASSLTRVPGPLDPLRTFNRACKRNPPTDVVTLGDMIQEFADESMSDAWNFLQYLMGSIHNLELPSDDVSFSHMFDMPSEQSWTCQDCGETFTREVREEDTIAGGSVGISVSLQDAGASTTLVELLDHHFNTSFPRRCQGALCAHLDTDDHEGPIRRITRKVTQTPEVLMIQLKRFIHNKHGTAPLKLRDHIEFDEYLNLGQFTRDGEDVLYRLDGVVAHRGTSTLSGHYMAVVRQTNGVRMIAADDDTFVAETTSGRGTHREMRFPNSHGGNSAEPYILIYSKI